MRSKRSRRSARPAIIPTKSWRCSIDAVPDLRPTIEKTTDEELAEIFKAFDVRIAYDKNRQALNFAATITSELMPTKTTVPKDGRGLVA
jgi:hypothetical protein